MRYYSTQRPVAPGTFPKPDGNKVVQIVNFDERQYCEEASRGCWGYIEYEKPLSEKQAADYELVREQLLDFKQRYMVGAGTSILRTFATAAELNEWFDAQIVENRHFCRLYDREGWFISLAVVICGSNRRNGGQIIRKAAFQVHRCFPEKNLGIE